jgi:hypothetical protein
VKTYETKPSEPPTTCPVPRCGYKRVWKYFKYDRVRGGRKPPRDGWRAHCAACAVLTELRHHKRRAEVLQERWSAMVEPPKPVPRR